MAFAGGGALVGSGNNAKVAVGLEETAYGTSAAAQMFPGMVNQLTITREDLQHITRGFTNTRNPRSITKIGTQYRAVMRGELVNGVPLAMGLGYISGTDDPTVGILKGPTHTTPTKSYLPSWSLFRSFDETSDDDFSLLGWVIDRFTLSGELNGPILFNLEGPAKAEAATAASPTITDNPLGSWNTTLSVDEGQVTYGLGTPVTIDAPMGWEVSLGNTLDTKFAGFTTGTIKQPIPGIAEPKFTFRRRYIDDDLWDNLGDGTVSSYRMLATDGTVTITLDLDGFYSASTNEDSNLSRQSENAITLTGKDINATIADAVTYVAYD